MSPLYSHPRTYCEKQGALDSDGDIARDLVQEGRAVLDPNWACYHTEMYDCKLGNTIVGIVGRLVGECSLAPMIHRFASGGIGFTIARLFELPNVSTGAVLIASFPGPRSQLS